MESDCLAVFHGRDLQADSGQDDQSAYSGPLQFLGACHSSRVSLAPAVSTALHQQRWPRLCLDIDTRHTHVIKLWTRVELTVCRVGFVSSIQDVFIYLINLFIWTYRLRVKYIA